MVRRDKEGYYIMINGSILQDDITIINIYTTNLTAPKYINQILKDMKGEIDNRTVTVEKFNKHLAMNRSSRH